MTKNRVGFTIVELIVVVLIIGILAGVVVLGYGTWRQRTATDVLKSDLTAATSALESARNFGNGYPTSIPTTFSESDGVDINGGGSTDGKTFCLNGTLPNYPSVKFYTTDTQKTPITGTCVVPS